jgi:hypothetical protein
MDERTLATGGSLHFTPECGTRRYPILSLGSESCLIEAP